MANLEETPIDPLDRPLVEVHLVPGERLLWTGRPSKGTSLSMTDVVAIPIGLLFCSFFAFTFIKMVFLSMDYSRSLGSPAVDAVFVGLLALGGLLVPALRYFSEANLRRQTVYALSTERAFIVQGAHGQQLLSRPLSPEVRVTMELDPDLGPTGPQPSPRAVVVDRGSIQIGEEHDLDVALPKQMYKTYGARHWPHPFTFEGIAQVHDVYQLVCQIMQANSAREA